eukprot:UN09099
MKSQKIAVFSDFSSLFYKVNLRKKKKKDKIQNFQMLKKWNKTFQKEIFSNKDCRQNSKRIYAAKLSRNFRKDYAEKMCTNFSKDSCRKISTFSRKDLCLILND